MSRVWQWLAEWWVMVAVAVLCIVLFVGWGDDTSSCSVRIESHPIEDGDR